MLCAIIEKLSGNIVPNQIYASYDYFYFTNDIIACRALLAGQINR